MGKMKKIQGKILVVDDDLHLRRGICLALADAGHEATGVGDGEAALAALQKEEWDLVLSDLRMPVMDGMELLVKTRESDSNIPFIMITAHGTIENAVEAMKAGAWDYIMKPFSLDELDLKVNKALERSRLEESQKRLIGAIDAMGRDAGTSSGFCGMIGKSATMQRIFELISRVAQSDSTVLITGESGTGKELVARALHQLSGKKGGPYISVNCAAVPESLLESELFGHVKGAFTGATDNRAGRFELAHGGSLFLDEIGELPLQAQAKLLRAVQEKEIERIGGNKPVALDMRLITATNRNLDIAVSSGSFRDDLLWRLKVIEIHLPPLRERKEDILLLAEHFLNREKRRLGRRGLRLGPAAVELLQEYHWPGNVRELSNMVERAALLAPDDILQTELFQLTPAPAAPPSGMPGITDNTAPHGVQSAPGYGGGPGSAHANVPPHGVQSAPGYGGAPGSAPTAPESLTNSVEELERTMILNALRQTGGNVAAAARQLDIKRTSLLYRMEKLGIR